MAKYNGSKVARRTARTFAEGDYILELVEAKPDTSRGGFAEVVVVFAIRDSVVGYNNARVFEHLIFADKKDGAAEDAQSAFEVAINKLKDMGLDGDQVEGNTLKQARDSALELFTPKFRCQARLYEDLTTGRSNYSARRYMAIK